MQLVNWRHFVWHIVLASNENVSGAEKTAEDYCITAWWLEISPWDMSPEMKPCVARMQSEKSTQVTLCSTPLSKKSDWLRGFRPRPDLWTGKPNSSFFCLHSLAKCIIELCNLQQKQLDASHWNGSAAQKHAGGRNVVFWKHWTSVAVT